MNLFNYDKPDIVVYHEREYGINRIWAKDPPGGGILSQVADFFWDNRTYLVEGISALL